jgi:hypothetical protein
MAEQSSVAPTIAAHGATVLPAVEVDSYNIEVRDDEGFIGDRASKSAFRTILENWRKLARKDGDDDPFGDEHSEELSKEQLDAALTGDDLEAAGLVHTAIEEFAQEFALVIRRYLKAKAWQKTERVVIGGGFRASRVGEMAIGRTGLILKADKIDIDLVPVRRDPDEAGLIGSLFLAPSWIFKGHGAILAVDIGGTNIRAGVVETNLKRAADLSKAGVWKMELWKHADEDKLSRDAAIERLIKMLDKLAARAEKEGLKLAPFIGIGCPGIIRDDGSIDRGVQNLPGNWASKSFSLPAALLEGLPKIGGEETSILLHNDAVVQGLSEVPFMQDVKRWGVLTIGTGLGNARFTNREPD